MSSRSAVRRLARGADRLRPPPEGLVVLIYHRVGAGTASAVDLDTDVFRAQMQQLAEQGTVISLSAAVEALQAGGRPTGVVITFDDGAADFCDTAAPIMAAHGLPSTLYLVTSAPDAGVLPWGPPAASWQALRDACSTGLVSVQSHTHDHRLLHTASAAEVADQLDRSVAAIADQLGAAPAHFAYPKAIAGNRHARAAVAARFQSAALAGHRVNRTTADLQRLGRVPLSRHDDMPTFLHKVGGGLRVEGLARDAYDRVRFRTART